MFEEPDMDAVLLDLAVTEQDLFDCNRQKMKADSASFSNQDRTIILLSMQQPLFLW